MPIHGVPSNAIQFHHNKKLDTYDSSHYWAGLTGGRMSEGELKHMLQEINAICKPIADTIVPAIYWHIAAFVVTLVAFVFYQIYLAQANGLLILLGVAILIVVIVLLPKSVLLLIQRRHNEIRVKCQALIDRYNEDLITRGLKWYLPHYFPGGIELRKEYEAADPENTATGYAPPHQHTSPSPS